MNKARRTVALQSRAFAAIGGTVALLDPTGTGDSVGDHGDATWDRWCDDVAVAWEWLARRTSGPCIVWGLRLGGLLAVDLVARAALSPAAVLLWQPVISGRSFFNQFLRLAKVRQLSVRSGGGEDRVSRTTPETGASIEVAGYEIHPAMITGAGAVDLGTLPLPRCPIIWRETTTGTPPGIAPGSERVAAVWKRAGVELDIAAVSGPSFWATQEITEASELVATTTNLIAERFVDHAEHPR